MRCPSCGADYEDGVVACADCAVELVPEGTPLPPPEGRLGRFEAPVAHAVAAQLEGRGIAARIEPDDPWEAGLRVLDVLVPAERRDELRAELVVAWPSIIQQLDPDTQVAVRASGGRLPGWDDAPDGVWIDREGRLQVSGSPEEEAQADAERTLGPAFVAGGLLLLVFAWFAGDGILRLASAFVGIALLIVGTLVPR